MQRFRGRVFLNQSVSSSICVHLCVHVHTCACVFWLFLNKIILKDCITCISYGIWYMLKFQIWQCSYKLQFPQHSHRGLSSGRLRLPKLAMCRSLIWNSIELARTYAHPLNYFKLSLNHLQYLTQWKSYVNNYYTVLLRKWQGKKCLYMFGTDINITNLGTHDIFPKYFQLQLAESTEENPWIGGPVLLND